jgi:SAM-dependent methyltransferase
LETSVAPTSAYWCEDLCGAQNDDSGADFFDPQEFTTRSWLEEHHYWHVHRRAVIHSALKGLFNSRQRLLEIGCGVGTVATHLNRRGFHVDYADVHKLGLRYAYDAVQQSISAPDKHRFYRLDISTTAPPVGYDGYLLFDVLEHLPDDIQVFANIAQAIKGGGRSALLVLTVPAFQHLWTSWDMLQHHRRRYSAQSLNRLAQRAGLRIMRLSHFFTPLYPMIVVDKILRAATARLPSSMRNRKKLEDYPQGKNHRVLDALVPLVLTPERLWLRRWNLPLGASLLCVLRSV